MTSHATTKLWHFDQLPKKAPKGMLPKVWMAYRAAVLQVGVSRARKPYPDHWYWKVHNVADSSLKIIVKTRNFWIAHTIH